MKETHLSVLFALLRVCNVLRHEKPLIECPIGGNETVSLEQLKGSSWCVEMVVMEMCVIRLFTWVGWTWRSGWLRYLAFRASQACMWCWTRRGSGQSCQAVCRKLEKINTWVLGQLPTGDNSPPDKHKAQLLPTSTTIPRATPHQDHYQLVKPLIKTNIYNGGDCPGGCPDTKYMYNSWYLKIKLDPVQFSRFEHSLTPRFDKEILYKLL